MKLLPYPIATTRLLTEVKTKMPHGKILHVGEFPNGKGPYAWVLADEDTPIIERDLRVFREGDEVPGNGVFVGSYTSNAHAQVKGVVCVVFEWWIWPR